MIVTTNEALRRGAAALRADAISADDAGPLADPQEAERDRAAARSLQALADHAIDPVPALAVSEDLRRLADDYMGDDVRFGLLVEAEALVRRALGTLPEPVVDAAELEEEAAEDRVARGAGTVEDLARALQGAVTGERLRIAEAACRILAGRILDAPGSLTAEERRLIVVAVQADW